MTKANMLRKSREITEQWAHTGPLIATFWRVHFGFILPALMPDKDWCAQQTTHHTAGCLT